MKKLSIYQLLIAVCAAAVSCNPAPPIVPEYLELTDAEAAYYGNSQNTGTGYYELELSSGNESDGRILKLALFGNLKGENVPRLTSGEYKAGKGELLTFVAGNGEEGSSYSVITRGQKSTVQVTGGKFKIELVYKTSYVIKTELTDIDGRLIKCEYKGEIPIEDKSVDPVRPTIGPVLFTEGAGSYKGKAVEYKVPHGYYEFSLVGTMDNLKYNLLMPVFSDLSNDSSNAGLTAHKYTVQSDFAIYTAIAGFHDKNLNKNMESRVDVIKGEEVVNSYCVTGGTFDLAVDETTYTITFDLILDDETKFTASFNGPVYFIDNTDHTLPDGVYSTITDDVDVTSFASGQLRYMGEYSHSGVTVNNWRIYLFGEGVSADEAGEVIGTGHYFRLEVNTPLTSSTTELIEGTYNFVDAGDGLTIYPGNMLYGEIPIASFYWEYKDGVQAKQALLQNGSLKVAKSGDTYTLTMKFKDDHKTPYNVTGLYVGALAYSKK